MAIATGTAIALSAASSLAAGAMQASAAKKAGQMAGSLQYQPIDLDQLQQQAQGFAQQNIAKSIELERQYMPELSAARFGYQQQIAKDLERGGMLPLDVANQVTRATMAQAGMGGFGAGPLTAAQLGITSYDLRSRALDRARMLMEGTPLPVSGIDPGSLASAALAQNQAQNQFQLSKMGAQAAALQSRAGAASNVAGQLAGLTGIYANRTPTSTVGGINPYAPTVAPIQFGGIGLAATSPYARGSTTTVPTSTRITAPSMSLFPPGD